MLNSFWDFSKTTNFDLADILCGKLLGAGISRQVYTCKIDPTLVVKIEYEASDYQNMIEWYTWAMVKHTEHAKWFAPCITLSENCRVLLQKKTTSIKKYPDKLPVYMTDTKRLNYGMYKGHVVCHDYGTNNMITTGMTNKLKKADWW